MLKPISECFMGSDVRLTEFGKWWKIQTIVKVRGKTKIEIVDAAGKIKQVRYSRLVYTRA